MGSRLTVFIICMAFILPVISSCSFIPREEEPLPAPVVHAYEKKEITLASVMRGDLVLTKSVTASYRPVTRQSYGFNIGGVLIMGVYVEVGDTVKTGDLLAELDRKEILSKINDAKIDLQKQQRLLDNARNVNSVARERYVLDNLRKEWNELLESESEDRDFRAISDEDTEDFYERKQYILNYLRRQLDSFGESMPESEDSFEKYEQYVLNYLLEQWADVLKSTPDGEDTVSRIDLAKRISKQETVLAEAQRLYESNLAFAEKQVELAEQNIEILYKLADERAIYATFNGMVTDIKAVSPTYRSVIGEEIISVSDTSEMIYLVSGPDAELFTPGEIYELKIGSDICDAVAVVREGTSEDQNTPTVSLYPREISSKPAAFGSVEIELDRRENALYLPVNCVRDAGTEKLVYYVDENGLRAMKPVATGLRVGGLIEILSGVSEGDEVIVG